MTDALAELVMNAERFGAEELAPEASRLTYVLADALPDEPEPEDQLVEGIIGRAAMSVLYGDSNSGKTFVAIDLGCAIARAIEWMNRNVVPGMVVYLATEAPKSILTRLQAYQRHHQCKVPGFVVVQSPIDLFDGAADAASVVALIKELEAKLDLKCQLVIGDTLARLAAGANENSGEDMSVVIRHVDRIKADADTHVLLIHHSGKDSAKGARGWSGLRAATDTELEVTVDDLGNHAIEIRKQRDMGGKGDRIGFRLQSVEMGLGQWGKLRTSCVVVEADAPPKAGKTKRLSEIAGAIIEVLKARGSGMKKGVLAEHLEDRYPKSSVYRELKKLTEANGRVHEVAGIVALRAAFTVESA